jgi:putative peptidoglycan lipid II flippase
VEPEPGDAGLAAGGSGGRARFAGAAALIAGLTIASRIIGFGRTLVLGSVAGPQRHITTAYLAANAVPNIIFEIVAGGALAALVVPLVAGAINRADRAGVARTGSALLTWVLTLLVPVAVVVAIAARPIVELTGLQDPSQVVVAAQMLRIFAIQIPLYGVSIVLGGLLQAHHRFAWPVLAPLLSSVVVIATYLLYAVVVPNGTDIPDVSSAGRNILAIGTTAGVAVLALCLIIPVWRMGLRLRPTYGFDADAGTKVKGLAWVGVITVAAQQLSLLLAIHLVNITGTNQLYIFTLAQTVYLVPWSVLAVPVATSVYPTLARAYAAGDEPTFRRTLASATRTVLLLSALGAALMIAAATPMARVFYAFVGSFDVGLMAAALIAFAPGLLGYGLFALHSRALYARHQNRFAAVATLAGWGAVALASVLLALALPTADRVTAVIAANSVGMVVLGAVLLVVISRRVGPGALAGVARAALTAVIAGSLAAGLGTVVRMPLPAHPGVIGQIALGMLSGVVVLIVFAAVAVALDSHDVRPLAARLTRLIGKRRNPAAGQGQ